MVKKFVWDNWVSTASFKEVWNNTIYIPRARSIPTCCSPDGKFLYLSSLDEAVEVDSVERLEQALDDVLTSYISTSKTDTKDALTNLKLAIRQCDFETICLLLQELKEKETGQTFTNDYIYAFPTDLFWELLEEKK